LLALDFERRCSAFFRFVLARLSWVKGLTGVIHGKMLPLRCSFDCSAALDVESSCVTSLEVAATMPTSAFHCRYVSRSPAAKRCAKAFCSALAFSHH